MKQKQRRDKVYLSGPISGRPIEEARRHFSEAEARMRREGWRTANPLRMRLPVWLALHGGGKRWGYPLCLALELLWLALTADAIFLLDGYEQSRGAKVELKMAQALRLPVIRQSTAKERKRKKSKGKSVSDHALGSAACH